MDFPINSMVIFHSYVSLPEGTRWVIVFMVNGQEPIWYGHEAEPKTTQKMVRWGKNYNMSKSTWKV